MFLTRLLGLALGVFVACADARRGADGLVVRRGDLESRLLLTGELEAAASEAVLVPITPSWQVQVRWLAEDGAEVAAGARVVEFDSGDLERQLADAELELTEAREELARLAVEAAQNEAEKLFALDEARARLAEKELEATVPAELVAARAFEERQLALERARAALDKAEGALRVVRAQAEAERGVAEVKRAKAERARNTASAARSALVGCVARAGVFVVGRHPWEARKVQVGDSLYAGLEVGAVPDLSTLRVRAALFDVDGARLRAGMEARCTLDAFPAEVLPCRVVEVSPVAREIERMSQRRAFAVRLSLARVDVGKMRPGQSVRVEAITARAASALLAGRAGLDLASTPPRARLASGELREIRLGLCDAQDCAVEEGLVEGERLASGRNEVAQ